MTHFRESINLVSLFTGKLFVWHKRSFDLLVFRGLSYSNWLDEFFKAYYKRRPVNATFIGKHEFDFQLPDFSEQGVSDTVAEMVTLLSQANNLQDESYSATSKIDLQLATGYLRTQLWEFQSHHFYQGNPCLYTGEAVFGVISLCLRNLNSPINFLGWCNIFSVNC